MLMLFSWAVNVLHAAIVLLGDLWVPHFFGRSTLNTSRLKKTHNFNSEQRSLSYYSVKSIDMHSSRDVMTKLKELPMSLYFEDKT